MVPELNQMSFRKIKELILEVVNMVDNTIFISVKDIMKTLSVSESKAYSVVRELNKELTEKGYMVIPGKVSRKYFKDLIMRDITPRDIVQWQNQMRESTDKDGHGYSGTYLRKMQAELSAIFNHAVKYYDLSRNPAVIAGHGRLWFKKCHR